MPITVKTTVEKTIETQEEYIAALRERVKITGGCKQGDLLKIVADECEHRFAIGSVVIAMRDSDSDGDVRAVGIRRSIGFEDAFVRGVEYEVITEAEALALPIPPAH